AVRERRARFARRRGGADGRAPVGASARGRHRRRSRGAAAAREPALGHAQSRYLTAQLGVGGALPRTRRRALLRQPLALRRRADAQQRRRPRTRLLIAGNGEGASERTHQWLITPAAWPVAREGAEAGDATAAPGRAGFPWVRRPTRATPRTVAPRVP